jgi:anaerobic dimethyl sulfoxide reductase subunit B (iron-sulfur subunit)
MTYAFTLDASSCTGCKACQEACKDKNQLPVDVLWRRVIEISGGEWKQQKDAWTNNVFAYNLSIACNHCVHPKCAGVCPVNAFILRADGIVYIDSSKCMGCGYCSWACPYGAPQYNPMQGQMTKCNFCFDYIDAGLPPSCVAACPLRVLNFTKVDGGQWEVGGKKLWELPAIEHPFPLPKNSHTEPHLSIKPHLGMSLPLEKKISNQEEIRPKKNKGETSLLIFTFLAQTAIGAFWAAQWMFITLWNLVQFDSRLLVRIPYLIIGACLGIGGFSSFAHLGKKSNAWRALTNLNKSWLSREILYVGLFSVGWLMCLAPLPWQVLANARIVTSLLGIALIYSMAQVYHLKTMPAWNTWRTTAGFFITAILSGQLLMLNVLVYESQFTGIHSSLILPWGFTIALLAGQLELALSEKGNVDRTVSRLRVGLIVTAIILTGIMSITPNPPVVWTSLPIFLMVMIEEIIGRWLFYNMLNDRIF